MAFWNKKQAEPQDMTIMILDATVNSDQVIQLEKQYEATSSLADFITFCTKMKPTLAQW